MRTKTQLRQMIKDAEELQTYLDTKGCPECNKEKIARLNRELNGV